MVMHRDLDQITRPNSGGIRKFEPQIHTETRSQIPLRVIRVSMWNRGSMTRYGITDHSIVVSHEQKAKGFVGDEPFIQITEPDLPLSASGVYVNTRQAVSVAAFQVGGLTGRVK